MPFVKDKISVIHLGIENISFLDRDIARKELLNFNSKLKNKITKAKNPVKWIGTISELHKTKGLEYIIKAISSAKLKNKNIIFLIIGAGENKKSLESLINKHHLGSSVFLLGHVSAASSYLKALDIFTLTSISEALGYVLLEAGQAGVPILASNVGGIPEIIHDMESGILVRSKNPDEISKGINFILSNPKKATHMSTRLKKDVSMNFSMRDFVAKTVVLYKSNS